MHDFETRFYLAKTLIAERHAEAERMRLVQQLRERASGTLRRALASQLWRLAARLDSCHASPAVA